MSPEAEVPGDDYWANEFDVGTSSTWRFAGADGVTRLSGPFSIEVVLKEEFSAQLTRVQLDHVALEAFEATGHTAVRGADQIAGYPAPLMTFVLLLSGSMRVELESGFFDLGEGEAMVIDSRDPFSSTASARTRVLRAVVGLEHLDPRLRERGATVPGALPQSALLKGFVAFVANILSSTASGHQARGDRLIQVVAELLSAVVAEAQLIQAERDGSSGLRYRMEQYIETHYTDPGLDSGAVAAAFGISLGHAHHVFNDDEQTLSRFIRVRRVAAVALELRAEPGTIRFDLLAVRYGFTSRDALGRAFQQRFGMTPTAYRDGGHRHLG